MLRGNNCTEAAKQQIFRFNPGKALQIFPSKHPYFKAPETAKKVIEDIAAEQEREYIAQRRRKIRETMAERLAEPLTNPDFDMTATLSTRSIKEFTNQPHKFIREKK